MFLHCTWSQCEGRSKKIKFSVSILFILLICSQLQVIFHINSGEENRRTHLHKITMDTKHSSGGRWELCHEGKTGEWVLTASGWVRDWPEAEHSFHDSSVWGRQIQAGPGDTTARRHYTRHPQEQLVWHFFDIENVSKKNLLFQMQYNLKIINKPANLIL